MADETPRSGWISRRQLVIFGAAAAGVVAVGATGSLIAGQGQPPAPQGTAPASPGTAPASPASAPPGAADGWTQPEVLTATSGILDLDLRVAERDVPLGGQTVRMLTYNGTTPGPTLRLRPGGRLRVHLHNDLAEATNLHTHGLRVSGTGNGDNPFVRVGPGESFDYEIELPADHPPGVCWYHPHHHGMVAAQIFGGLYGAILIETDGAGEAEGAASRAVSPRLAVISDVTVAAGAVATVSQMDRMRGRTGETLLVNGQPTPPLRAPAGSAQRIALVNACASRYLDLRWAGLDARLRGIDTGARDEPIDRLLLPPGSRADVVFTMPAAETDLVTAAYDRGGMGNGMMGDAAVVSPEAVVLTLVPDAAMAAPVVSPAASSADPDLRSRTVDATRTLTMTMVGGGGGGGMMGGGGMQFLIDGAAFDPARVDQEVTIGTVEEWTLRNTSPMDHPFHLHSWPMQVVRAAEGETAGVDVRDVVNVPAGGAVVVRIRFDRFPGRTVYHCHILDHEDLGMMGVIAAS
ncbi:multicopper oxidase family protein [Microbacterium sp.]|uniref:multicopper oxidase family protein n=1 Tax=Microbacterium sp. TaxID=51671 RepID=UPI003A8C3F8E